MGRQWNAIIDALSGGTMSINANLTDIEALLTTLQADVADGITVSSGTVTVGNTTTSSAVFVKICGERNGASANEAREIQTDDDGFLYARLADPSSPSAKAVIYDPVAGNAYVNVRQTASVTIGSLPAISGTVIANPTNATTGGTGSTDFTSTSYGTIATASTGRLGCTIFNGGPGNLHVLLGTGTASTSNFTVRLSAGDYYEVPFNYTGLIGGIFATAGTAEVTQLS